MPKIAYINKVFSVAHLAIVAQANQIIAEYEAAGFQLTLRQLYYQFVSRAYVANTQQSYKRLGSIVNDARLAGLIDWDAIEDRTRNVRQNSHWTSPAGIISSAASSYRRDAWAGQRERTEVWIEKDALVGVIQRTCQGWDVPFFACRGYVSQSEAWSAPYYRFSAYGKTTPVTVFYLGDHDPSGLDMSRDLQSRLSTFAEGRCGRVKVVRLALNWDQVQQYQPPPNPTKLTDSRANGYVDQYGDESWELDALEPRVIEALVDHAIAGIVDKDLYDAVVARQERERLDLNLVEQHWDEVVDHVRRNMEEG